MKVFLLGSSSANYPSFLYQCKNAFEHFGWEVKSFNYRFLQLHRTRLTNILLNKIIERKILNYKPDLLLVTKGETLLPEIIKKISKKGIKTVNWTLDEPYGKYYSYNKLKNIDEYDLFFIFDPAYVPQLKKSNSNTHYLPCSADPDKIHKEVIPLRNRNYKYDVSFVGTYSRKREKLLEKLSSYDLHIWGYGWNKNKNTKLKNHIHKKIPRGNKMCEIFNQSRINLNIHSDHSIKGLNMRTFEVPSTKSFLITDYYDELPRLFKIPKEIVFYKNITDLKQKIDYYLNNEKKRHKIAETGYKRVIKEHTIKHRIKVILEK